MKISWGWGIAVFYISFVIAMLLAVFVFASKDLNLVSKDYYEQELKYEDKIQNTNNYNKLKDKPTININSDFFEINFNHLQNVKGKIFFYRPSNSNFDKSFDIKLVNQIQKIRLNNIQKGNWWIKIEFESNKKTYYTEQQIIL